MVLFTYGTLMRGHFNHYILDGCEFLGEAVLEKGFQMFSNGRFPLLVKAKDGVGVPILGEIYSISDEDLELTDNLEIPNGYGRFEWFVKVGKKYMAAWVYVYLHDPWPEFIVVDSGKFEVKGRS